ncbi:MAG: hypothetical protein OXG27_14105 [Chloroflexi bacterium]|nr:hypothetical protein [Chloroflexota bacterium]
MALIPLVAQRSQEIAELCRKHQVQRLDLFGSAVVDTICNLVDAWPTIHDSTFQTTRYSGFPDVE